MYGLDFRYIRRKDWMESWKHGAFRIGSCGSGNGRNIPHQYVQVVVMVKNDLTD